MAKALKPGGWFGIQEHFICRPEWTEFIDGYYKTRLGTLTEYIAAAEAAGFELEQDEDVTDRVAEFWVQSMAWNTAELDRVGARAATPSAWSRERLRGVDDHARQAVPDLARPRDGDPAAAVPARRGADPMAPRVPRGRPPLPHRLATAARSTARSNERSDPSQGGGARGSGPSSGSTPSASTRTPPSARGVWPRTAPTSPAASSPRRRGADAAVHPVELLGQRRRRLAGLGLHAVRERRPSSTTASGCIRAIEAPGSRLLPPGPHDHRAGGPGGPHPGHAHALPAAPLHRGHPGLAVRRGLAGRPTPSGASCRA